jgi:hypothetical protein
LSVTATHRPGHCTTSTIPFIVGGRRSMLPSTMPYPSCRPTLRHCLVADVKELEFQDECLEPLVLRLIGPRIGPSQAPAILSAQFQERPRTVRGPHCASFNARSKELRPTTKGTWKETVHRGRRPGFGCFSQLLALQAFLTLTIAANDTGYDYFLISTTTTVLLTRPLA